MKPTANQPPNLAPRRDPFVIAGVRASKTWKGRPLFTKADLAKMKFWPFVLVLALAGGISGCSGFFDPLDISDRAVVTQIVDADPTLSLAGLKAKIESRTGFTIKDIERSVDGEVTVWAVPESEAIGSVIEGALSANILNNPTPVGLVSGLLGALIGVAGVSARYRRKHRQEIRDTAVSTGSSGSTTIGICSDDEATNVDTTLVHEKRAVVEEPSTITGGSYAEVKPRPAMESVSVNLSPVEEVKKK